MNSSLGQHKVNIDIDEEGLNDRSGKPKAGARKKGYTNPWDIEVTGRAGISNGMVKKKELLKPKNNEEAEKKIEEGFEKILNA
jgi:hypothetical protein